MDSFDTRWKAFPTPLSSSAKSPLNGWHARWSSSSINFHLQAEYPWSVLHTWYSCNISSPISDKLQWIKPFCVKGVDWTTNTQAQPYRPLIRRETLYVRSFSNEYFCVDWWVGVSYKKVECLRLVWLKKNQLEKNLKQHIHLTFTKDVKVIYRDIL